MIAFGFPLELLAGILYVDQSNFTPGGGVPVASMTVT
jgi:hypothetical protein